MSTDWRRRRRRDGRVGFVPAPAAIAAGAHVVRVEVAARSVRLALLDEAAPFRSRVLEPDLKSQTANVNKLAPCVVSNNCYKQTGEKHHGVLLSSPKYINAGA